MWLSPKDTFKAEIREQVNVFIWQRENHIKMLLWLIGSRESGVGSRESGVGSRESGVGKF
ncbi:hypothetical protein [Moorena producens]|uniref:hypothetical protein n=1 Tax=Moorena producens TaxID=1155739 RepID=UPI003C771994